MKRSKAKQDLDWITEKNASDSQIHAQYRAIWDAAAEIEVPDPGDSTQGLRDLNRRIVDSERKVETRWKWLGSPLPTSFAAAAVLILLMVMIYFMRPQVITTGRGEQQMVTLSDGSPVVLNADSTLRLGWGFGERHREMKLVGEAYFSVTKGVHPFVVETEISEVEVLGTEFNVRIRDDLLEVGVTRGLVMVSGGDGASRQSVQVAAGQMTQCARDGFPTSPKTVPTTQYPPWRYDRFYFDQTSLDLVCQEIARALDIRISIDDPTLTSIRVTGLLHGKDADALIGSLCLLIGRDFEVSQGFYRIK